MENSNIIPQEIKNNSLVKSTILAISIMWDVREEKDFFNKCNWLNGMHSDFEDCLSLLFKHFADGDESVKSFAKRIANIK